MSERFSRVHIADVNFDEWYVDAQQRISYRNAGMCESSRVDNDSVYISSRFVDAVQDYTLVV